MVNMEDRQWVKMRSTAQAVRGGTTCVALIFLLDYPGCVCWLVGVLASGRRRGEEWVACKAELAWDARGALPHIVSSPRCPLFYSSFGSTLRGCQPVFHGPAAWAVSARWVLCLIQKRAQRFGTKTQRGFSHPLQSHAKLGTAFPPAVKNVCGYSEVTELVDVSPASSPHSDRLHSNALGIWELRNLQLLFGLEW